MSLRRSKIGWCDYSGDDLNFVIGCTPVSEGCANCYAAAWAKRCGRDFIDVVTVYWQKLNRLRKAKLGLGNQPYRRGPGSKPIMFPVNLGDLFHRQVSEDFILWSLSLMADRDDADWVLLTKRPERMLDITNHWLCLNELSELPDNIWCLTTVENQRRADQRIPILLQVKAAVLGISAEPMLEELDFYQWLRFGKLLDWVIVGAESGPRRRAFQKSWAASLHQQCEEAGVPFFYKQSSGLYPGADPHLHGQVIKEFPRLET